MKKLLTLLIFLFSTVSYSQEIEWQKTIGGNNLDALTSMEQTSDGGYILGGTSISDMSGDKSENSNGNNDFWIIKLDSLRNIVWQNTIGGYNDDQLSSIKQTSDGGYILGGSSNSDISGDKTEHSNGDIDYWIVKIDSIGNIQWQNTIGGSSNDYLTSIIQTSDGNYIASGYSGSSVSGDKSENNFGGDDYWILKLNQFGNIMWQNTIGGDQSDYLTSIIQTNDEGYLLSGYSDSDLSWDKTENSNGGTDFWIVKTDSMGIIEWQNTIGGSDDEWLFKAIRCTDNGLVLGGCSKSGVSGDKLETAQGNWDFWVVKTDSIGNLEWQNTIGGSTIEILENLIVTKDRGYLLGGYSNSMLSGDKSESSIGTYDFWIIKTDNFGNIIWQNSLGGDNSNFLSELIQTTNGSLILGGSSNSNISGDKSEDSKGDSDFWFIKISEVVNSITGTAFVDLNSNLIFESSEIPIESLKLSEHHSGRISFSQKLGKYYISMLDTGNFEISPDFVNLFNPVPLTHTGNFSAIQQIDSLNDFAFQPTGTFNDLCISISPLGNFRSGFNANYALNYSNLGNTILIPTIVFYPDNNVTFVSASITPTTITPDSVVFVLGTMNPFQSGQITITVNVNTGLPIGTLINSGAMILPIANDANPGCNSSFWEVFTTGSYDPNDIIVNRKFIYDYEMPAPPDLEYIIRYQNTGNDTAFTVKILNPLDTNRLDLSTLEMVATSHPADIRFVYHERNLEFVMNNVLLPDSNINEPMSHGFVRYRITPKTTVAVGDSIQNFAAIYFDFNNPVITNTAVTKIIQPTGVEEIPQGNLSIFPNPTNNKITIRLTETAEKITEVNVFNIYGQEVKAFKIAPTNSAELDISELAQGVYYVRINNKLTSTRKVIKL